jgi:hypothetical protein
LGGLPIENESKLVDDIYPSPARIIAHSMSRANLNKVENFMKNTTTA